MTTIAIKLLVRSGLVTHASMHDAVIRGRCAAWTTVHSIGFQLAGTHSGNMRENGHRPARGGNL